MRFKPCVDFFRKGNRFLLTWNGKKKVEQIKVTGTKIAYFFKLIFNLPNEEEQPFPDGEEERDISEYRIWSRVFNFPYMPKRNPKKQERYREVEERIKDYLERELRKKWSNYPINKYDVFDDNEFFGGVPDGEELDNEGKTISILEIKTVTEIAGRKRSNNRFYHPPINYQLQLGLYMYLRGLSTGYLCICFLQPENWQNVQAIQLNSPLKPYLHAEQTFSGILESYVREVGDCSYEYTILEAYCNDFLSDNETILFKLHINMTKYENMLKKIKTWFTENKQSSPGIPADELSRLLSKHRNW